MMRAVRIPVKVGVPYDIWVGFGRLGRLGAKVKRLRLGTHAVVLSTLPLRRYAVQVRKEMDRAGIPSFSLWVPDTERSKSMGTLTHLLDTLAQRDAPGRRLFLVTVGGGVVGDLGGLAAGLYQRGIPYIQVPTTLLAQVDSSIGGKTAVDLPHGKNLVGLFYHPRLVFVDGAFLSSLSDRQFRSGLAEVAKCGIIQDAPIVSFLEGSSAARLRRSPKRMMKLIGRSIRVKVALVEKDEREIRGLRTLLNFGHTFGHALEAATGYSGVYTHGESVSIGMRVAMEISVRLKRISRHDADRILRLLKHLGLPTELRGNFPRRRIFQAMAHDKKWAKAPSRWVLPVGVGRAVVQPRVPPAVVRAAVRCALEKA